MNEHAMPRAAFAEWLRARRLAPENRVPYLVRWVERFQCLQSVRSAESWRDTLRVFLDDLADTRRLQAAYRRGLHPRGRHHGRPQRRLPRDRGPP